MGFKRFSRCLMSSVVFIAGFIDENNMLLRRMSEIFFGFEAA